MEGSGIYTEDPVSSCSKSILPGTFSGPIRVSERTGDGYKGFHQCRQTEKWNGGIVEKWKSGIVKEWVGMPLVVHYLFSPLG